MKTIGLLCVVFLLPATVVRAETPPPAPAARFTLDANRVHDGETGLSWLGADNGADIDWKAAGEYCASKSARLPTQQELKALHNGGTEQTPCGEFPCQVSALFRLTSRFQWTSEAFGADQAVIVGLAGASRPSLQSIPMSTAEGVRALCVSAE